MDDSSLIFVKQKLLKIKEKNISTIIIASHDKSIIEEICDEVIHMQDGRII